MSKRQLDLDAILPARLKASKVPRHSSTEDEPGGGPTGGQTNPASDEQRTRSSVVHMLSKALGHAEDDPGSIHVANEVEQQLFELEGGCTQAYKAGARKLSANLKRNTELSERVTSGAVSAYSLVRMDSVQLATTQQQEELARSQDKLLRMATIHDTHAVVTADYVCPDCKSTACSYVELGRRDIGKSETWGAKSNEDRGRHVTCLTCGHKWEATMA